MPRTCTVCTHPDRAEIDGRLVTGTTLREIAETFRLTITSVHRHQHSHLPASLKRAHQAHLAAEADGLLARLEELTSEAHRLKGKAEAAGDLRTALSAIRELVRIIELLAKLRGELDESPKLALVMVPEWLVVQRVLAGFPEARQAVIGALEVGHG